MAKVTLDRDAFKALASDTRLMILRSLDGKKMTVTELSNVTKMNKATMHEHLSKLHAVGLIKRNEREGHKWVYYKLSWKGASLLHPENNRIVVMFSTTFLVLIAGIGGIINYVSRLKPVVFELGSIEETKNYDMNDAVMLGGERSSEIVANPFFLYIAFACIICFLVLLVISYKRYKFNKKPKL